MPLPGMLPKRSLNDLEVNMPSLLDAAEAFSKLGKKSVEIDQAACVRVRHRHAELHGVLSGLRARSDHTRR